MCHFHSFAFSYQGFPLACKHAVEFDRLVRLCLPAKLHVGFGDSFALQGNSHILVMVLPMQHQGSMGKPQHILWLANELHHQGYKDSHSQNPTMGLGNMQAWDETKHGS